MDLGLIREIAPALGLGAVVVVVLLIWKRIDDQRYAATLAEMNDRLLKVVIDNTSAMNDLSGSLNNLATSIDNLDSRQEQMQKAIEENISASRELFKPVTELRVGIAEISARRQAA